MKIQQKPKFQPITITLETDEEAKALWDAVSYYEPKVGEMGQIHRDILNALSNWFCNNSQLL